MTTFDPNSVKHADLHDAQEIAGKPDIAITLLDADELYSLEVGDYVKVGVGDYGKKGSEAFWVDLLAVGPLHMYGSVANVLKNTDYHGLQIDDILMIQRSNVLAIH
jgi:hypothetical protein